MWILITYWISVVAVLTGQVYLLRRAKSEESAEKLGQEILTFSIIWPLAVLAYFLASAIEILGALAGGKRSKT